MKLIQPVLCRLISKATIMLTLWGLHISSVEGADDNTSVYYTNGLVNGVSGDINVGNTGTNNYLEVSNATTLTNSGDSFISHNSLAMNNQAVVSGPGSIWNTLNGTYVGYFGGNAQLLITNSGAVNTTGQAMLGYYVYDSVSNNQAIVTGNGSLWTIGTTLYVGNSGHDNRLIIANGGTVTNLGSGFIGNGAGASNNLLFVTDSGSSFVQSGSDFILSGGGNNSLVVANGGRFKSTNLRISGPNDNVIVTNGGFIRTAGVILGDSSAVARGDTFLLSGTGSTVTNSGATYVGNAGANATLRIEKGGAYTNGTITIIGSGAGSSNNLMIVTDAGSIYRSTGDFNFGGGGSNTLVVANGGTLTNGNFNFANKNNQILVTNGGTATAYAIIMGNAATAIDNRIVVSGAGSVLNAVYGDYGLLIGYNGASGSKLLIDSGGVVNETAGNLYVGGLSALAAQSNIVSVTGAGSQLNIGQDVRFAYGGATASRGNQITVADGARMTVGGTSYLGYGNAISNIVTITGSGAVYSNNLTKDFFPNYTGVGNQLIVTNGGQLITLNGRMGQGGGVDGLVKISGSNSLWRTTGTLTVGETGNRNHLVIENGATVSNAVDAQISYNSSFNDATVSGVGSIWHQGGDMIVGYFTPEAQLVITNGGTVNTTGIGYLGRYYNTVTNAIVRVTGAGSKWTVGGALYVGYSGANDQLIIENGGVVTNNGTGVIGYSGSNDLMRVDGIGSAYVQTNSLLYVGFSYGNNQLVITNGGKVVTLATQLTYGNFTPGEGGSVMVTGKGSTWTNGSSVTVGGYTGSTNVNNKLIVKDNGELYSGSLTVGSGTDSNRVLVTSGGLMEINTLGIGSQPGFTHNSISNIGGIYQFTTTTPSISPGLGTISVTDGTVSFRSVGSAPVGGLAGLGYFGNNTFRLNNSSNNTLSSYTFNTGLGATNYTRLELVNGGSRWQGANLTIGTGGSLLVSNAANAMVAATLNSTGAISVVNSRVTYASNVVINGSYISDPSTNTFLADVTVGQSGTLAGGAGDLFDFKKSLYIHATNNTGFNLSQSAVTFSGGGLHTNAITAADMGGAVSAFDNAFTYPTNFAYGELHLGSAADQICFECGNLPSVPSNALYIGWLDLLNTASLVTNLHAPGTINLYYYAFDTRNAYLGNQTYQLTACDGVTLGGFLMPVIPEPSAVALFLTVLGCAVIRRKGINK